MTPERIAELRALADNPWGVPTGALVNAIEELLDEVERLRREHEPTDEEVRADLIAYGMTPEEIEASGEKFSGLVGALAEAASLRAERDGLLRGWRTLAESVYGTSYCEPLELWTALSTDPPDVAAVLRALGETP